MTREEIVALLARGLDDVHPTQGHPWTIAEARRIMDAYDDSRKPPPFDPDSSVWSNEP